MLLLETLAVRASIRFGVFELDLQTRELRKRGMRLRVPDQSLEILAMLAERPGVVVTREEIYERLWPNGTNVEFEHSVNSAVKRLRDALGDSAATPRFIETLPRRGYRLLAPPENTGTTPAAQHFRILGQAGRGAMGVVYKAEDLTLGRTVALKFLPEELSSHKPALERFRREARIVASLNHPGICTLYGVEEEAGRPCLVMEYLEGQPLSRLMESGPLAVERTLQIARQAAEALAAAHAHGIVHRDFKPANVFVTGEGQVKILDFGLAKDLRPDAAAAEAGHGAVKAADFAEHPAASGAGQGTLAYMSPEQVRGEPLDARSDLFSLGVVLYEMLCGRHPFAGDTAPSTVAAVLHAHPEPPRKLRHEIPERVERLVLRCLEKKPADRYPSADAVLGQLRLCQARRRAPRLRLTAAVLIVLAIVSGLMGGRAYLSASRARWVEREALPGAARLAAEGRPLAALRLLQRAERYGLSSAATMQARHDLSVSLVPIHTTPPGASIFIADYEESDASRWERLGRSPLERVPIPAGDYRIRAEKDGFEPVERLIEISGEGATAIDIQLHGGETTPAGMVWVPGTAPAEMGHTLFPALPAHVPDFWIDRHEVTNRQFKEFVDAGGYRKREYWKETFKNAGQVVTWEQAMAALRDASGKPGPASWELGSYPEGKADYPVGGVSWYEAAAYAEFAGKRLPTVYHWFRAAGVGAGKFFSVLKFSNFTQQGPAPVGTYRGLGPFGTYDMAGNVKEWCSNPMGERRYMLGGAWNDPDYQLTFPDAQYPRVRGATFGFRCVRYTTPVPGALAGHVPFVARDRRGDTPAGDAAFQIYRDMRSYDRSDLDAIVESTDESPPYWRREKITFRAGYGKERVVAHLYLPRNAAPPYQVVVYFPGSTALVAPNIDAFQLGLRPADQVVRSGRAVILPAYKGTLERGPGAYYHWLGQPNRWKDMNLQWSKDLGRSLDCMESRKDIDIAKLGYLGRSLGAAVGPYLLAVEPRIKTAILLSGGSFEKVPPEVDSWNFASRVTVPVLMQNGRDDFFFPLETSQIPLFRLLGPAANYKQHLLYDGAHGIYTQMDVVKDMLDWLDRYLGPVTMRR